MGYSTSFGRSLTIGTTINGRGNDDGLINYGLPRCLGSTARAHELSLIEIAVQTIRYSCCSKCATQKQPCSTSNIVVISATDYFDI